MSEETKEQIFELDENQLQEMLGGSDKLPPIEIPFEFYNDEEFYRGISETSYLSGVITAMLNAGVSESFVLDYLLNKENITHNIEVAKINKEMNIEMSKSQKATQEKFEL